MKTAEEILSPYVESLFRHTRIVEKDNALLAMERFADQFKGMNWIATNSTPPPEYEQVLYFNSSIGEISVGYFVWSQSPAPHVTHWMFLPAKPE